VDEKRCLEYRKRIRLAVNQISAVSEQVQRKIEELSRVLTESQQHRGLHLWCLRELSRAVVNQGDDQVAQFQGAAFCIAAVAVGIAARYADFAEILIA
jgi:hypothetical protein